MNLLLVDDSCQESGADNAITPLAQALVLAIEGIPSDTIISTTGPDMWYGDDASVDDVIAGLGRYFDYPFRLNIHVLSPTHLATPGFLQKVLTITREHHGGIPACALCLDVCWELTPNISGPEGTSPCKGCGSGKCECGAGWTEHLQQVWSIPACALSNNPATKAGPVFGRWSRVEPRFDKTPTDDDSQRGFAQYLAWVLDLHNAFENERNGFVTPIDLSKEMALVCNQSGLNQITHGFGAEQQRWDLLRREYIEEGTNKNDLGFCVAVIKNAIYHLGSLLALAEKWESPSLLRDHWDLVKQIETGLVGFVRDNAGLLAQGPAEDLREAFSEYEGLRICLAEAQAECTECQELKMLCRHGLRIDDATPLTERTLSLSCGPLSGNSGDVRDCLLRTYLVDSRPSNTLADYLRNLAISHGMDVDASLGFRIHCPPRGECASDPKQNGGREFVTAQCEGEIMPLVGDAQVFVPRREFFQIFDQLMKELAQCKDRLPIRVEVRKVTPCLEVDENPYVIYFFAVMWGKEPVDFQHKDHPFEVTSLSSFADRAWVGRFYNLWYVQREIGGIRVWRGKDYLRLGPSSDKGKLFQTDEAGQAIGMDGGSFPLAPLFDQGAGGVANALIFGITSTKKKQS